MPNPPVPTVLKKLRGNPGKRAYNDLEPMPDKLERFPDPPKGMPAAAKKEWYEVGPLLFNVGCLTSVDLTPFKIYCLEFHKYQQAIRFVKKHGAVLVNQTSGVYYTNPAENQANKLKDSMRKFWSDFGMTPVARTRIEVDDAPKEDPMEKFLADGQKLKKIKG